ncbi:hypothetical protein SRHO_G00338340 [Serrasalmus rhombeus]
MELKPDRSPDRLKEVSRQFYPLLDDLLWFKPKPRLNTAGVEAFEVSRRGFQLEVRERSRRVDGAEWVSSSSTSRVEDITRGFGTH